MRYLHYALVLLLLTTSIPIITHNALADEGQNIEERIGDWIIYSNTVVINRTIVLEGNLYIRSGGLEFINSTLEIRAYAPGQFRIEVEKGNLSLHNSTITAEYPDNRYYIVVRKEGNLSAFDSTIEYAGYEDGERSGVYVEGNFHGNNTTFRENYCPLWLHGVRDTVISGIVITKNMWGMRLVNCENVTVSKIEVFTNYRTGIWLEEGENNVVKECSIDRVYRPSSLEPPSRGILLENESFDVVERNSISNVSGYGVLVQGQISEKNTVKENIISYLSTGIYIYGGKNTSVEKNIIETFYMGISVKEGEYTSLRTNFISAKVGVRIYGAKDVRIISENFENISSYAIMLYYSNTTYVFGAKFKNVSYNMYLYNSIAVVGGHMYSDKYRLRGETRLYFALWEKINVFDHFGRPMNGVKLELWFLGEKISETHTYGKGNASFYAPYVLHTPKEKIYSWCEVLADRNISFEENPIRFYAWESRSIVFRERAPGLEITIFTDKKEAYPGDLLNITVIVENRSGYVDNATVDISLNGKPVFPPENTGSGAYVTSVRIPDFKNSLKIEVSASYGDQRGNASTTIMMPSVPYNGSAPQKAEEHGFSHVEMALGISVILLSAIAVLVKRRHRKKRMEDYMPMSPDRVQVER